MIRRSDDPTIRRMVACRASTPRRTEAATTKLLAVPDDMSNDWTMAADHPPQPNPAPPAMVLILRPPVTSDADWITTACQDPDIQRWTRVPVPYERFHAEAFIADWAGSLAVWAVMDTSTHRGVATAAIHRIDDGDAALGYWVAPWARQRGVATWATLELVSIASSMDAVASASLDISNHNPASQGVARRAGFSPGPTPEGLTVPDGTGQSAATRYIRLLHQ